MSIKSAAIIFVLMCTVLHQSYAVTSCYYCANCPYPFYPSNYYVQTCYYPDNYACAKITQNGYTTRACSSYCKAGAVPGGRVECCFSNYCNDSSRLASNVLSLSIFAIVSYMFMK